MTHNFNPWFDSLGERARRIREFYFNVFTKLNELGFQLENPNAIEGGYRLEFRQGDKHVVADRWMSFPVLGETPGLALHDDMEEWDCTFSARSPINLVLKSLEYLAADENE